MDEYSTVTIEKSFHSAFPLLVQNREDTSISHHLSFSYTIQYDTTHNKTYHSPRESNKCFIFFLIILCFTHLNMF